jgi:hypothetical protein
MTPAPKLRLAEWIEGDMTCEGDAEIAAELRRLHEVNKMLLEALQTMLKRPDTITAKLVAQAAIAKATGEQA